MCYEKANCETAEDARFSSEHVLSAPAVFANNDMKYEVNNSRSQAYAARQNVGIMYCPAKDTPSSEAIHARPDLPAQKLNWLHHMTAKVGSLRHAAAHRWNAGCNVRSY